MSRLLLPERDPALLALGIFARGVWVGVKPRTRKRILAAVRADVAERLKVDQPEDVGAMLNWLANLCDRLENVGHET